MRFNKPGISFASRRQNFYPFQLLSSQCPKQLVRITNKLQYSSKNLKHLCAFHLPQCCLGYYGRSSQCSKIHVAQHRGRRGAHLSDNKSAMSECKNQSLEKIHRKQCLFQQFVTSIVVFTASTLWFTVIAFLTCRTRGFKDETCIYCKSALFSDTGRVRFIWLSCK